MATNWNGSSMKDRLTIDKSITYAFPKEGIVGWFDSIVVPNGAKNVDAAKKFMNFVMAPENIAISSNFARYANAIKGSSEYFDADMKTAPELATPTVPVKFAEACSPKAQKLIERVWTQLLK
jgi:spermidine/putrescine transport system substrate-binding protein